MQPLQEPKNTKKKLQNTQKLLDTIRKDSSPDLTEEFSWVIKQVPKNKKDSIVFPYHAKTNSFSFTNWNPER